MERSAEKGPALERRLLRVVTRLLKEPLHHQPPQPLVVAVSGGADSLALLMLLAQLQQPLGLSLHVAHLDHGLRGMESGEDARFVEEMASSLKLPSTLGREDVAAYRAAHHLSLEEAAREVRYSFLSRVAAARGATAIALGHTADDQAETILMHLLRGSGLAGLAGMSPLGYWPSPHHGQRIALVRPLLGVRREETESYCRWKGVVPREDASNRSLHFTRNRIRLDLLPRMMAYNPRLQESLLRLGRAAAQEQAYILSKAGRARERLATRGKEGVSIQREGFAALPTALQSQLLRLVYQEVRGSPLGLEHRHLEEMMRLAQGETGKHTDLPGGLVFYVDYGSLKLGHGKAVASLQPPLVGEHPVAVPGDTRVPGWSIRASLLRGQGAAPPEGAYRALLDREQVGEHLHVRGRRPGDRFQPLGMEGAKKLQDFMVDARVPGGTRDGVPLVLSERGIVWVVGYRIAHWARLREETREMLGLEFFPEPST